MSSKDLFSSFLEASAGASASVWSTVVFYPLDVLKTRKQSEVHIPRSQQKKWRMIEYLAGLVISMPKQWRNGLKAKVIQTVVSSFIYFAVYTFLKRVFVRGRGMGYGLVSAGGAAMVNTLLTLPLDLITTQLQTRGRSVRQVLAGLYAQGVWEFWRGLGPSLLLSANPAIHYTLFDALKAALLKYRGRAQRHVGVVDAFVLGVVAKFIATIATYPLIRAKVLMMTDDAPKTAHAKASDGRNAHSHWRMLEILTELYRDGGWHSLYYGCNTQLLHTLLKNALLLATKERIGRLTTDTLLYLKHKANK